MWILLLSNEITLMSLENIKYQNIIKYHEFSSTQQLMKIYRKGYPVNIISVGIAVWLNG